MILWIIFAIVIVVFIKYIYLIIKRFHLLIKIGNKIKKHHGSIQYYRNPMISIFKHDGEADISLKLEKKTIDISIVTTPLRPRLDCIGLCCRTDVDACLRFEIRYALVAITEIGLRILLVHHQAILVP